MNGRYRMEMEMEQWNRNLSQRGMLDVCIGIVEVGAVGASAGGRSCMEEFVSITAGGDPIIFAKLAEYQEQSGVVDLDIKYLLNQNTLAPGFVNRIALNARRGRQGCYAASTSVPTTGGGGEG